MSTLTVGAAIIEGGYRLEALQSSTRRVLDEMNGAALDVSLPEFNIRGLLPRVREVQQHYWERVR